jgi:type II secretory pathway pseudopilin PulG
MKVFGLGNKGDTIVEVLIVLAILSFAITISYSSATRSLEDARQSEENSYATELAQSQIEAIRSAVNSSDNTSTGSISNLNVNGVTDGSGVVQPFCMYQGSAWPTSSTKCQITDGAGGVTYSLNDTLTLSPAQQSDPYSSIFPLFPFQKLNTFQVYVKWPDALGQGYDTTTLFYRVYPPS